MARCRSATRAAVSFEAAFSDPGRRLRRSRRHAPARLPAPDPLGGRFASLRFTVPSGVSVDRVWLGRLVNGPGYWARPRRPTSNRSTCAGLPRRRLHGRRRRPVGRARAALRRRPGDALRRQREQARLPLRRAGHPRRPGPTFTVGSIPSYAHRVGQRGRRRPRLRASGWRASPRRSAGRPCPGQARPELLQRALAGRSDDRPAARRGLPGGEPRRAADRHARRSPTVPSASSSPPPTAPATRPSAAST